MSPLEVDHITSQDKAVNSPRPLALDQTSFLQVNRPGVVLVTWKVAEDGAGTVLRFLEVAGKENAIEVQAPLLAVRSAWMSDALERKQEALSVSAHGFQVRDQAISDRHHTLGGDSESQMSRRCRSHGLFAGPSSRNSLQEGLI